MQLPDLLGGLQSAARRLPRRGLSHYDDDSIESVGLYLAEGVEADAVIAELEALSGRWQRLYVTSNAALRQVSLRIFDQTFVITDVLYWLTLGVAFKSGLRLRRSN